jgi:uncharacterized damage-inducible protein DinB
MPASRDALKIVCVVPLILDIFKAEIGFWIFLVGASMSSVRLWFDRKFDFSFPAQLYPNICVRLRGTPARLEDLLRGCPREQLVKKPRELERGLDKEKWSIQEHAGHLLDLEPLWTARVEDFTSGRAELTVADLTNRGTSEANHNARPLAEILAAFRAARVRLLERAAAIGGGNSERTLMHPRMKKPMRLVDHLYFVAEHDDHHLAWMWQMMSEER